jgi:alpha-galactosidase
VQLDFDGVRSSSGVTIEAAPGDDGIVRAAIVNDTVAAVAVDRVGLRWRLRTRGRVRLLRHGYQSWSPTGGSILGVDEDPSRGSHVGPLVRGTYHADPAPAAPGELRSELVTLLADDEGAVCLGFSGGDRHDGTFRVREGEIVAEAYFGGALLAAGERRELHAVRVEGGDPTALLERWAAWAGRTSSARTGAPYRVGWCSWYQYFHGVTEEILRANLGRAADWPIEVFQLDDGYQAAIGDWLLTAATFPSPLERLATDIAARGYLPGLWLAPFLVAPRSRVAVDHPDWIAPHPSGHPLVGMVNPFWGGGTLVLDTTHPAVLDHLERLARALVRMGWRYLKLDFTYAPSLEGRWHDPARTPAERVRAGYDAIRRGAGDDTFILGCGAPLGPCIGVVDGMRIGPDVAPHWHVPAGAWLPHEYRDCEPATVNAWRNTLGRVFQHRRLWLCDPDCLMLRTTDTGLSEAQVRAWAMAVALSGGMAVLSDDLGRLGPPARQLLDEVLAIGRDVDGRGAVCPDLMERWTPTTLAAGDARLVGDPEAGTAVYTR